MKTEEFVEVLKGYNFRTKELSENIITVLYAKPIECQMIKLLVEDSEKFYVLENNERLFYNELIIARGE